MWFRMLSARYEVDGRCLKEGGRERSVWWKKLVRLSNIVDFVGELTRIYGMKLVTGIIYIF